MLSPETPGSYSELVAAAADLCMKPWKHSVINKNNENLSDVQVGNSIDLNLRIECRDSNGERHPDRDLELELYKSGIDLNLMLYLLDIKDQPILWYGKHSLWMDPNTGKRCSPPDNSVNLEAFARRLKALFVSS